METWRNLFDQQWGTGSFWKKLLSDFDRRKFLEYDDVLVIIKKAQIDLYKDLIEKDLLDENVGNSLINKLYKEE